MKAYEVGYRIKYRRKQIGLSAEKLAEQIGCHASTIYRYEAGDISNMRIDKLGAIAEALNVSEEFLAGWDDDSLEVPLIPELTKEDKDLLSAYHNCPDIIKDAVDRILEPYIMDISRAI